jgi:hypothetical protein
MHIYPKTITPVRPETPSVQPPAADDAESILPLAPAPLVLGRSDRVVIPKWGGALSARDGRRNADDEAVTGSGDVGGEADRVRSRILSGAYDRLEMVVALARRLLDSGDL